MVLSRREWLRCVGATVSVTLSVEALMNTVWILVCDSAKSRLFETQDGAPAWVLLDEASHEESRSHVSTLVSDHVGSRSSDASVHNNALAPASSPKEVEQSFFARALVKRLDHSMRTKRFRKWVLVAPPHFVGLIKKELTPELDKHLMTTLDKNLTELDARALTERLRDAVRIPPNEREVIRASGDKHPR
jgi:protein required for attachment to host cells